MLRAKLPVVTKIDQRAEIFIGFQPNAATVSTVATIGATERNKFFPTKTDATVATGAGEYCDDGFVNEFHNLLGLGAWDWGLENSHKKFCGKPSSKNAA
jgi:hypothetical protein